MASRGFPAEFIADRYARGPMQARAATVTGRAARERRVIHIHDVAAEPDYPEDSIDVGKQRSSLGVPLVTRRRRGRRHPACPSAGGTVHRPADRTG